MALALGQGEADGEEEDSVAGAAAASPLITTRANLLLGQPLPRSMGLRAR